VKRENKRKSREIMGNQGKSWVIKEEEREPRARQGYKKLVVWRNAYELRRFIYQITKKFPRREFRRTSQMNDSARSIKQNIQEGYTRKSLGEYIHFLSISQSSLNELLGDIEDCFDDELISKDEFSYIDKLIGRTDYLFMRLIQSLERKREE
jgi:four helix bundle protein